MLRLLPGENAEQLYVFGSRTSMTTIVADGPGERHDSFMSYPLFRRFREHTRVYLEPRSPERRGSADRRFREETYRRTVGSSVPFPVALDMTGAL